MSRGLNPTRGGGAPLPRALVCGAPTVIIFTDGVAAGRQRTPGARRLMELAARGLHGGAPRGGAPHLIARVYRCAWVRAAAASQMHLQGFYAT
jgi:hypothetical protein